MSKSQLKKIITKNKINMKTVKFTFAITALCCVIAAISFVWCETSALSKTGAKTLETLFILLAVTLCREYYLIGEVEDKEEDYE